MFEQVFMWNVMAVFGRTGKGRWWKNVCQFGWDMGIYSIVCGG